MISTLKKIWNDTKDKAEKSWLQLTLAGIFATSLATFNVVFPPAVLPTIITLITLAVSTALIVAYKAVSSYLSASKEKEAVKTEQKDDAKKDDAKEQSSSAKMTNTLAANKVNETQISQAPKANAPKADTPKADAPAANDHEHDAVHQQTLTM